MSSKKKLIISLSVAAAVLVAAVIAIVAVFAAASQTVATSTIKVSYTANAHVVGSVSSTYSFGTVKDHSMTTDGGAVADGNDVISFNVDSSANAKTLQIQATDLTDGAVQFGEAARELVITFNFVNEGSKAYTATLTPNFTTTTNMVIEYSADKLTWDDAPTALTVAAATQGSQQTGVYYAKISINNVAFDAAFEGSFSWLLEA